MYASTVQQNKIPFLSFKIQLNLNVLNDLRREKKMQMFPVLASQELFLLHFNEP